jgi:hypothetical protein
VVEPEDLAPMTAVLEELDRILGNPVLTVHSVVSVEGHSRCAEPTVGHGIG